VVRVVSERRCLWFARICSAVTLAALVAGACRGAVGVRGEKAYARDSKIVLTAGEFPFKGAEFTWDVEGTGKVEYEQQNGKLYVWAAPGRYTVRLDAISWDDKKFQKAKFTFTVVENGKPKPPDPKPDDPPPALKAMRVLVVYESGEAARLPAAQQSVLYGKAVRDDLNAKTPVGPDGKTREWRIYDKDVDLSGEDAKWAAAMGRARKGADALPWVLIFDGEADAYSGPLPKDVPGMLALTARYAPKAKRKGGG
jgi:hypothetical protein